MLIIKSVADIMGLYVNGVCRLCGDGNIPNMKFGQKIMVPKVFLLKYPTSKRMAPEWWKEILFGKTPKTVSGLTW